MASRIISRISPKTSALFVCDIQEKFRPITAYYPEIVEVARRMIGASHSLGMHIVATEQYPKGLGPTVAELELSKFNISAFAKTNFSMCIPEVMKTLPKENESIILVGIAAHVCILQSAMDLMEQGKDVHVIVDAVSAVNLTERKYAFEALKEAGAKLRTSESVIYELLKGSGHPNFKAVQSFIKTSAPDSGLMDL
uniref:Isochorismatase domain-containing protein n=1 Tax=Rhabditophanes sp. KR3021 TaxID=114890 RepID=A0AC35TTI4_9BILA